MPSGLAAVLNATVPMFGALVAWAWFRDRPDNSRLVGLVVGFVGVALLASRGTVASHGGDAGDPGATQLLGVLACLAACLSYWHFGQRDAALPPSAFHRWRRRPAARSARRAVPRPAGDLALAGAPAQPACMAGACGAGHRYCTGVAYILFFRLIAEAGPARALTVTFLVPVFAVVYGAVFLDEPITMWMLMCAAAIVCGVALSTGIVKLPIGATGWRRQPR